MHVMQANLNTTLKALKSLVSTRVGLRNSYDIPPTFAYCAYNDAIFTLLKGFPFESVTFIVFMLNTNVSFSMWCTSRGWRSSSRSRSSCPSFPATSTKSAAVTNEAAEQRRCHPRNLSPRRKKPPSLQRILSPSTFRPSLPTTSATVGSSTSVPPKKVVPVL